MDEITHVRGRQRAGDLAGGTVGNRERDGWRPVRPRAVEIANDSHAGDGAQVVEKQC